MSPTGTRWRLNTDGSAPRNSKEGGPTGIGVALYRNDVEVASLSANTGWGTVNTAEFNAILFGVRLLSTYLKDSPLDTLEIQSDSQTAIGTLTGEYENRFFKEVVRNILLELQVIFSLQDSPKSIQFISPVIWATNVTFKHIPRELNTRADELSGLYTRTSNR